MHKKTEIKIGYARVSSVDNRQKLGLEVQQEALKFCDYVFSEKSSGANDDRKTLKKAVKLAKKLAKSGRKISFCVYKMDRLSRKTATLLNTIDDLKAHKIEFISLKENIDTRTPTGILMYQLLGIFAEFELNNIKMRTKEGLDKAKKNGVKLGRKPIPPDKEQRIIQLYLANELSNRQIAKLVNVAPNTVNAVLRRKNITEK